MGIIMLYYSMYLLSEAESNEKHGVWDLMPELTITSPDVDSSLGFGLSLQAQIYTHTYTYTSNFSKFFFGSRILRMNYNWL